MIRRPATWALVAATALAGAALAWFVGVNDGPQRPGARDVSPAGLLGSLGEGDSPRVTHPWEFRFPRDHGAHEQYRTESWRFAGTLGTENDRRLGVSLIVMRVALQAEQPDSSSRWAARDVYAGLLTLADSGPGRVQAHQRLARGALGLAGAESDPIRIRVEDWLVEEVASGGRGAELRMKLDAGDVVLDLDLRRSESPVMVDGTGQPGTGRAPPFAFYIEPRMGADGDIRIADGRMRVSGVLSLEHAWGELPLPGGPVARDRFTLFLDDGRELFCTRTHRIDGSGTPAATGLLVERDGRVHVLAADQIDLVPVDHWASGRTGARYPVRWSLRVPQHDIELQLLPLIEDAEAELWEVFWAGPVRLERSDATVGEGFVRLRGYSRS